MSFLLKADRSPGLGGSGDGTRVLHRGGRRQDEGVESHGERGPGVDSSLGSYDHGFDDMNNSTEWDSSRKKSFGRKKQKMMTQFVMPVWNSFPCSQGKAA